MCRCQVGTSMMILWWFLKILVWINVIPHFSIVLELKKLGIELDMPPNKLKTGHGDGVVAVLYKLTSISVQNKVKFRKPVIKADAEGADEEGDDMGDDLDGGADIADMAN